jgi:putative cofactor-binding repeat protein
VLIAGNVALLGCTFSESACAADAISNPVTSCEVLHWDRKGSAFPYLSVVKPGKYCIDQDYRFSCSEWLGSCGSSAFLEIFANDVEVDLQGHTLSLSGSSIEIFGRGRNIVIKNGVIKKGKIAIQSLHAPSSDNINRGGGYTADRFDADNFTRVENMRIETGSIAISAANAVVRNNDVALNAGFLAPVVIRGPHPVVENNRLTRSTQPSKFSSYGIYLRDVEHAVVRGNTIRNYGTSGNTAAVALRDSQSVHMENNRIDNFERPLEQIDATDGQAGVN